MIFYLIFNGSLYLTQLVLYAALFLLDTHGIFQDDKQDRLTLVRLSVALFQSTIRSELRDLTD